MARYGASNPSITPNTSNDNWGLQGSSSHIGWIWEFHWGGEVTTSTAMHSRIARGASGASGVAGNVAKLNPNIGSNAIAFNTGWTTQPTLDSGDLWAESWNAHGGVVRWLAAPGEEFIILANSISCRNTVGTALSSYGVVWREDE